MKNSLWKPIFNIVGNYLLFGILWISLTDPILHFLVPDQETFLRFEVYKGWFFIFATATLLTLLLKRQLTIRNQVMEKLNETNLELTAAIDQVRVGNERFRATFEQDAAGIAFTDSDLHITDSNQKFGQILHLSNQPSSTGLFTDLIHPLDRERVFSLIKKHQNTSTEVRLHIAADETVWANLTIIPVENHIDPIYYIFVLLDISHLKQVEEDLRDLNVDLENRVEQRTNQLKQANQDLENFAYSVSHDLRAPIRALTGYSSILMQDYHDSIDQDGLGMLQNIHESGLHMNQLIDDLLRYARLGQKSIEPKPLSLGSILQEMQTEFAQVIADNHAQIDIDENISEVTILGEPTLLHQVFVNLLDNAIKYQPPGNQPHIHIAAKQTIGWAEIHFSDNGIGIPPEQYDRVFNIFHRLHKEDYFPGTGIGLALVKRAVELLNGKITVGASEMGGACFRITLNTPE